MTVSLTQHNAQAYQPQCVHDLVDEGRVQGSEGWRWGPLPLRTEGVVYVNHNALSNITEADEAEQRVSVRTGGSGDKSKPAQDWLGP